MKKAWIIAANILIILLVIGFVVAYAGKYNRDYVASRIKAFEDRTFAQEQITAIRKLSAEIGLDALPEPLKDAALLRITNPAASLADLASLSIPPVTKSCLNHRLKKIVMLAREERT